MTLPEELISANHGDNKVAVTCPYLGTMPDPHTSVAYPSGANYCHRAENSQLVSLAHQGQHCLAEAFDACETYRDDIIPVASIDVGGPVKTQINWKRPLTVGAFILLFGVLLLGAYAVFSPLSAETVDASTPIKRESENASLAINLTPTPTRLVNPAGSVAEADAAQSDESEQETLAAAADATGVGLKTDIEADDSSADDPTTGDSAADDISEDAKMAPISETPTPRATSAFVLEDNDVEVEDSSPPIESTPDTKPLPTASTVETELAATAAAVTPLPTTDDGIQIADGTAVIRTGALNVRSGAGPQYPSTALVYNGEHVILLGRNGDSSWVKIRSLKGYVGWIYAAHIEAGQPLDEIPFIPRAQR